MKIEKEKACAKLNISLDVANRRDDGYHEMIMVMQTVSLGDEVSVRLNDSGRVSARTSFHFIPGDERNLAVKAALCYLEAIDRKDQGAFIEIEKVVPVGAGMGGGSADAAAVLRAMNRLFGRPLSMGQLAELAGRVGSDVAFCLVGGTALATGRGEKLRPLPAMPECSFVVCKPEFSVSTPELFRKLDMMPLRRHPDTAGLIDALEKGQLNQVCRRMYNVFEDVDDRRLRSVADIKSRLLDHGALGAVMTGTGSAVFGVFRPGQDTARVCAALKKEYGFCEKAVCTGPFEA